MDASGGREKISAPFRTLGHAQGKPAVSASNCKQESCLVDLIGIEPMTSSMP
jgi:hypothetical protein